MKRAAINITGSGPKSTFTVEGIAEGRSDTLKNPVTGEDHVAEVHLPTGFIWTKGECGSGTYRADAAWVSIGAENTNMILYGFDWSNAA